MNKSTDREIDDMNREEYADMSAVIYSLKPNFESIQASEYGNLIAVRDACQHICV